MDPSQQVNAGHYRAEVFDFYASSIDHERRRGRQDFLIPGDVVTVTRIEQLARSTFDLFAIVKQIVDTGGQFRSLAEPWADTATNTGSLKIAVLACPDCTAAGGIWRPPCSRW